MSSYPQYDLDLHTRDEEHITITTASYTRMGIAEVAIEEPSGRSGVAGGATVITAKQARQLADTFDKLATFWGE
jgi:hypothetical protein